MITNSASASSVLSAIAAATSLWLQDVLSVASLDVTAEGGQLIVGIGYTVLATGSAVNLTLSVPEGL